MSYLTVEQVVAVGEACAENAYSLLDDAAVLARDGRVVRAFFLTTIAAEEFCKYLLCRDELNSWSGNLTPAKLNKRLRDTPHAKKRQILFAYFRMLAPNAPLPPEFNNISAVVAEEQKARNRALYVEAHSSGVPMTPDGVVKVDAALYVRAMGQFLTTLKPTVRAGLDNAAERARGNDPFDDQS